ncbi:GNAT family N-acetyltransferase [Streptomyces griseofuscus]|uniref:GNAT family N-acetyltransferase n=1 Tax=Streptomyces griseofuscus TaxID=146922 RepID=UPI0033E10D1A
MDYRHAVATDAPAMAELFAANHYDALTERERAEQGFVQGAFDTESLRSMAEQGTLLVADDDGHLAGLLGLATPENLTSPPPPIRALLAVQDSLHWQGRPLRSIPFLLYGPVVVAAAYRGRRVARGLFTAALRSAAGRADLLLAFIELSNQTSWRVHVNGFGMTPLGDFTIGSRTYGVVGVSTHPEGSPGT